MGPDRFTDVVRREANLPPRVRGLYVEDAGDGALADDLMTAMQGADWTLTFRRLADAAALRLEALGTDSVAALKPASSTDTSRSRQTSADRSSGKP